TRNTHTHIHTHAHTYTGTHTHTHTHKHRGAHTQHTHTYIHIHTNAHSQIHFFFSIFLFKDRFSTKTFGCLFIVATYAAHYSVCISCPFNLETLALNVCFCM